MNTSNPTPPSETPVTPVVAAPTPEATTPLQAAPAPVEAAPLPAPISIEDFMKVKLRVALVEAAEAVPKSKKLLKLQLDVGPLGKRQILSGISQFYTPESLIGKKIILVSNLQPAKLMGIESNGMLLAASSEDGTKLTIVDPGQDMPVGSEVR